MKQTKPFPDTNNCADVKELDSWTYTSQMMSLSS